jgi:pimeloyl-ACP methyl ester carboxylesterase
VAEPDLRTNPGALPDAEPPRIGRYRVNGTRLYAEVRGSGPAVLLIHADAEDAEGWRPIAERLTGFTVVTYDRRGTLRSGRDDWPGGVLPRTPTTPKTVPDVLNGVSHFLYYHPEVVAAYVRAQSGAG